MKIRVSSTPGLDLVLKCEVESVVLTLIKRRNTCSSIRTTQIDRIDTKQYHLYTCMTTA